MIHARYRVLACLLFLFAASLVWLAPKPKRAAPAGGGH